MRRMYSENQLKEITNELLASGKVPSIKADSIIENMSGYSFTPATKENITFENIFIGCVKNGNKITFVTFVKVNRSDIVTDGVATIGTFTIPSAIGAKLYPYVLSGVDGYIDSKVVQAFSALTSSLPITCHVIKPNNTSIAVRLYGVNSLELNTDYLVRSETTFLLSDNLAQ